jgi:hypothetical protein
MQEVEGNPVAFIMLLITLELGLALNPLDASLLEMMNLNRIRF